MLSVISSVDELCVLLKVPRHAAKAIFRWARDQEWPEGTELEDFNEYHVTMLYSPNGYNAFHDVWWANPDLDIVEANIVGFDNFGPGDTGRTAYVLNLESEQLQQEAEAMQQMAAAYGAVDTHFGSYKPHITVGYGPVAVNADPPKMELDLGPLVVSEPRREVTSYWDFAPYSHFHPYTGLPCNCLWGSHTQRHHRTAGQHMNQALKTHAKWFDSPEGADTKEYLGTNFPQEYDSLAPYITQQSRRNNIVYRRNDNGLFPYFGVGNAKDEGYTGASDLTQQLPRWHQWFEARQHPTRRGVNVMDSEFHPMDFAHKVAQHQRDLQEQRVKERWLEQYPQHANVVHRFGPEAGKYKNWNVVKLDANQAEGDTEALGHCIGRDDQPYKHNIEMGNIDAYSLRDPQGYPHVSWHFNPGGEDIGHMQGKSGDPSDDYRKLITHFHNAAGLPDEEGYEEPLEEPYDEEYELPPAENMDDYVGYHNRPYEYAEGDRVGPETLVSNQPPYWPGIAQNYLDYGGPHTNFFRTLSDFDHGDDFAHALRDTYDPSDREHRKAVDYYNEEGPGSYYIPVAPGSAETMDDYHDMANEGNEPEVENWDKLAEDYFDNWVQRENPGYFHRPHFPTPTNPETTEGNVFHNFVPSVHNQGVYTPPDSVYQVGGRPGYWSGGWDHRPEMQQALSENADWNDPYHQEAIQYWNTQHPQHNVFNDTWNAQQDGPPPSYLQNPNDPNRMKLFNTNHGLQNDYRGVPNWKDWNQQENPNPPMFLTGARKVSNMGQIADNLHQKFLMGTSPTDIVDYAKHLLGLVGYPNDDMSTQAALQAWQTVYPDDQILQHTAGWDFNSGFENLVDQYSPYGLSCLYDESPDTIDISHLEVDPSMRSNGIGSKFMDAAHQYAQSVGKKIQVSRVDNVPFFNKFPFLNQVEDKKFVTAMWNGMQFSGSPVAAKHSFNASIPGDDQYYNRPIANLTPNPHSGEHQSWIAKGEPNLYVKPETQHDYHQDSPIKERAAFVLGNSMGMNVPHTVVRNVKTPLKDKPGQRTAMASIHHGVPNSMTLGDRMDRLGIKTEYYNPEYDEFLKENEQKRRQMLLLDQITGNPDRHSGNLLIDHNGEWYPIDHGAAFQNIAAHGPDWYMRYEDFHDQPLTPEEMQQVQAARAAIDHPANQELFSQPELYPERLNERVNNLLDTGKFRPFSWA